MRPALLRTGLVAAAAATAVLATSATAAAPKEVVLSDIKGDGNALNDTGIGLIPSNHNAAPTSRDAVDAVKLTLANTYKKVGKKTTCTGFTATLELAGAPTAATLYRMQGVGVNNDGRYWLRYIVPASGAPTTDLQHESGGVVTVHKLAPAKVADNKIIFTVTAEDVAATKEKPSFLLSGPKVDVRGSSGAAFAPVWDLIDNPDGLGFKVCA